VQNNVEFEFILMPRNELSASSLNSTNLLFGDGIFTSFKMDELGICFLDDHIHRLKNSFHYFYDDYHWPSHFKDYLKENLKKLKLSMTNFHAATIRLALYPQTESFAGKISLFKIFVLYSFETSSRIKTLKSAVSLYPFGRHKRPNYLEIQKLARHAKSAGFDDILLINEEQMVLESSFSGLGFVDQDKYFFPELSLGILNSLSRQHFLQFLKISNQNWELGRYHLDILKQAEEVFLLNSTLGVVPIQTVDDRHFQNNFLSNHVIETYNSFCQEHSEPI
jgi:branched-subunit amino acid aminotransferase/4-amino-4-deoxychorismate lyase